MNILNMLTDEDIKKIGEEVGKVIEQNVTPAIDGVHGQIDGLRAQIDGIHRQINEIYGQIDVIRGQMVTKEYLDDKLDEKLADLRGDLVVLMRKEDRKVRELIDILHQKNVLNQAEVKRLLILEPFPTLMA
mgnify:CR=1 FL=1